MSEEETFSQRPASSTANEDLPLLKDSQEQEEIITDNIENESASIHGVEKAESAILRGDSADRKGIRKSVAITSKQSIYSEKSFLNQFEKPASSFLTKIRRSSAASSAFVLVSDPKIIVTAQPRKARAIPVYTKSDSSVYPSYTELILPYRVVCRQRYQQSISGHQEQFIKEMCLHERLQPYALGGVRLRREFCDPILTRVGSRDIIRLTLEEERRLEYILKTDPKAL